MKHRLIYSLLGGLAVLGTGITTVNASAAVAHVAGTHQVNSACKFLTGATPISLGNFSNPNAQFNISGDYIAMSTALGNMPVGGNGRFVVNEQNLPVARNVMGLLDADSLSSVNPKQLRDYLVVAAAIFRHEALPAAIEAGSITFVNKTILGVNNGSTISFYELKQSFRKFCNQVQALQSPAQTIANPEPLAAAPYQPAAAAASYSHGQRTGSYDIGAAIRSTIGDRAARAGSYPVAVDLSRAHFPEWAQPPQAAGYSAEVSGGLASSPSIAGYALAVGPMRPGTEFTDLELSTAGAMLQGINPADMLARLQTVFSAARAKALFDKILEG